jgi:hypothetical protein
MQRYDLEPLEPRVLLSVSPDMSVLNANQPGEFASTALLFVPGESTGDLAAAAAPPVAGTNAIPVGTFSSTPIAPTFSGANAASAPTGVHTAAGQPDTFAGIEGLTIAGSFEVTDSTGGPIYQFAGAAPAGPGALNGSVLVPASGPVQGNLTLAIGAASELLLIQGPAATGSGALPSTLNYSIEGILGTSPSVGGTIAVSLAGNQFQFVFHPTPASLGRV